MKKLLDFIPYILIVIFVILIRQYVMTPVSVNGDSMEPTLFDQELLILNKLEYKYNEVERFDIVVINYDTEKAIVKRVIGLPGEYVEYINNKLYIDDELVEESFLTENTDDFNLSELDHDAISENMYFVIGDNRNNSTDSRVIGLISKEDIMGEVFVIIYPFNKFGKIK